MYEYQKEKAWLFSDEGQRVLLKIRDKAREWYELAGAVRVGNLMGISGLSSDSWQNLACIDRLVELKEYQIANGDGATQNWILIR